jgi:DNA (cytosine-5)-methyltransferase 1
MTEGQQRQGLRYIDVCAGISAPTMGWKKLGWRALVYADISPAPLAVLKHHYPDVPQTGDFTQIEGTEYGAADLVVGGTPCQDYSVAGQRAGLDGNRGNLTLEFSRLAYRARARWLVWENVPGVFSTNGGRDFGAILATFSGRHGSVFEPPEGGWRSAGIVEQADAASFGLAWRVLDAQYFGVPQRRRRVFVIGYLGDWRRAAAVLLERHGLQGHPAPRRKSGQAAPTLPSRSTAGGGLGTDFELDGGLIDNSSRIFPTLDTAFDRKFGSHQWVDNGQFVMCASDGQPNAAIETDLAPTLSCQHEQPYIAAIQERAVSENPDHGPDGAGFRTDGQAYTLEARTVPQAVAFAQNSRDEVQIQGGDGAISGALAAEPGMKQTTYLAAAAAVRRLTPRECERLQGFPDDFTLVPYRGKLMADGPRYKMLGNSWAVPCGAWIGERIQLVEDLIAEGRI